ncbi:MAG: hypothetical protein HS126_29950 [Anaerolineales bacterium]|nr:hypothetical protein [Anaerolineales bacterium]
MTTQNVSSNLFEGVAAFLFTTAVMMPLTKAVFNYIPATTAPGWIRRLVFPAALKRAYTGFAGYYPQWAASLFDEHFLNYGATSLMVGYIRDGRLPQASPLALDWDAQLGPDSPAVRERRIAELTPVAADFLDWLTLELAISPFS